MAVAVVAIVVAGETWTLTRSLPLALLASLVLCALAAALIGA